MTFDELKTETKDRLNYTSTATDTRVGRLVNKVYRSITTAIGMQVTRVSKVSKVVTIADPEVIFTATEKVERLWRESSSSIPTMLIEVPLARLRESKAGSSDKPLQYAVKSVASNTVTVRLDATPATAYTLYADVIQEISDLSGSQEPAFPESFHDVIIEGVLKDEYRKLEKVQLARESEREYEKRLSDLRMFMTKSWSMEIQQGIYADDSPSRTGIGGGSSSAATTELSDLTVAEIILLGQVIA